MSRLPVPGQDDGTWGTVLNDFLGVELNADGSLKRGTTIDSATSAAQTAQTTATAAQQAAQAAQTTADAAIKTVNTVGPTSGNLNLALGGLLDVSGTSGATDTQVLSYNGTTAKWSPATLSVGGGSTPDATTSTKGIVQLAGDLGGTAAAPTLAATANVNSIIAANTTVTGKLNTTTAASTYAPKASPTFTGTVTVPTPINTTDAVTKTYVDTQVSAGTPDATTSAKGKVQLAGDLGGTAASPTVPGLAAKATDSTVVHNTGAETIAGVKTFSSAPVLPSASLPESAVTNLTSDLAAKAPLASPTFTGTVTVPTPVNTTDASTKAYVDAQASSGTPDATTSAKGKVQLAGDLAGTAAAPVVAKVNGVTVSGTPSAGQVIVASSSSAAAWQAGSSATLAGDTDVAISSVSNGQVLTYNSGSSKWQNATPSSGGGASVGSATPAALGSAAAGTSANAAHEDHVHPTTGLMLSSQATSLKAVNTYSGSAYPTRPSGYGSVEWIGPVDPGSSALANDTWVNTA